MSPIFRFLSSIPHHVQSRTYRAPCGSQLVDPRLVGKCSKYEKSGENEREREREIGARDSCRASRVFRARARFHPLSRNAERKPTDRDLVSTLCLRAEPANRIDLHDRASGNLRSGRFLRDKYFSICVRPIKRNDFSYDR